VTKNVKLSAALIESFAGVYLSPRYDDAKPTPEFHREAWELYASDHRQCSVIAPRDHAKSTALTFDYILAAVCFRVHDYVILIGSTEDKAAEQLSNISEELEGNTDLRESFGISHFESQTKTEIIVVHDDGHRFRILARGAEQKIRGAMWNGKRPNLIVADDMEDDEQVENKDRRAKFRKWFFRAAKQALSKKGKIRVHGTILHEDSLLNRLKRNSVWKVLFYKAHKSYNDFSELLWPERWTEADLRERRKEFEEDGDSAGYSQEFLNTPLDSNARYLKMEGFIAMSPEDYETDKIVICGADFATSKNTLANKTSFTAGGKDINNIVHIIGQNHGRWATDEWVEELFDFDAKYQPIAWIVEKGQIWDSVYPFIYKEMQKREHWIDFVPKVASKDKAARGQSFRKRHNAKGMRYDKSLELYSEYEVELISFTGVTEAKEDDCFDSTAYVSMGFDDAPEVDEEDFQSEEEYVLARESRNLRSHASEGRSSTGY
jgi:hypothetical protein